MAISMEFEGIFMGLLLFLPADSGNLRYSRQSKRFIKEYKSFIAKILFGSCLNDWGTIWSTREFFISWKKNFFFRLSYCIFLLEMNWLTDFLIKIDCSIFYKFPRISMFWLDQFFFKRFPLFCFSSYFTA